MAQHRVLNAMPFPVVTPSIWKDMSTCSDLKSGQPPPKLVKDPFSKLTPSDHIVEPNNMIAGSIASQT